MRRFIHGVLVAAAIGAAVSCGGTAAVPAEAVGAVAQAATQDATADLQWIEVTDRRLAWTNVGDWEARGDGLQPVRVPKAWRNKLPENTARRALSAAGVFVRFRTGSPRIAVRATLINEENESDDPAVAWERARPPYFDVYRNGRFVASVDGAIRPDRQDIVVYDDADAPAEQAEFTIALPFYYRNGEIILNGIGVAPGATVAEAAPDSRPRVLFHGDSITHGHGVFVLRETYPWQACERAGCVSLNLGFGGAARGDNVVAQYIASRTDWDVLVIAIGTNSFGGNYEGKPESAAQYGEKYDAFLSTIRSAAPAKPIVAMTPVYHGQDHAGGANRNGETPQDYRDAIRRVVERRRASDRNLHFVDGRAAFEDPLYLLPTDIVHPNVAGMLRIADTLVPVLRALPGGRAAQTERNRYKILTASRFSELARIAR
jgi:lysophospholipase L1-like esterase